MAIEFHIAGFEWDQGSNCLPNFDMENNSYWAASSGGSISYSNSIYYLGRQLSFVSTYSIPTTLSIFYIPSANQRFGTYRYIGNSPCPPSPLYMVGPTQHGISVGIRETVVYSLGNGDMEAFFAIDSIELPSSPDNILSCFFKIYPNNSNTSCDLILNISLCDTANYQTFINTTDVGSYLSYSMTDVVTWVAPSSFGCVASSYADSATPIYTSNFSPLLKQIIGKEEWSSGNSIFAKIRSISGTRPDGFGLAGNVIDILTFLDNSSGICTIENPCRIELHVEHY